MYGMALHCCINKIIVVIYVERWRWRQKKLQKIAMLLETIKKNIAAQISDSLFHYLSKNIYHLMH